MLSFIALVESDGPEGPGDVIIVRALLSLKPNIEPKEIVKRCTGNQKDIAKRLLKHAEMKGSEIQ